MHARRTRRSTVVVVCVARRDTYSIFDVPLFAVLCDHSVDFALVFIRFLFVQIMFLEQPVFIRCDVVSVSGSRER